MSKTLARSFHGSMWYWFFASVNPYANCYQQLGSILANMHNMGVKNFKSSKRNENYKKDCYN